MLEICVLGQFSLSADGRSITISSRPAQSLFAYLALNQGVRHRREKLAGMLWPEASEANSRSYLRAALWRIRKSFEEAEADWGNFLEISDIELSFRAGSDVWLDADLMLERQAPQNWGVDALSQTTQLYAGDLLPGFYDEWVVLERERLHAAFQHKMNLLLDMLLAERRWDDVLAHAEGWVALGYAPESAYRALMIAHAALGNLGGVRVAYDRCHRNLASDFGLAPSDDLDRLAEDLERGHLPKLPVATPDPHPAHIEAVPPEEGDPPYKGLAHFDASDAGRFFGREALIDRLISRLSRDPGLAIVVGSSGSGKSSLVRAGLASALQGPGAPSGSADSRHLPKEALVRVITPSRHPLEALAGAVSPGADSRSAHKTLAGALLNDSAALRTAAGRLMATDAASRFILIIDQFEELFTLCDSEPERDAFVENVFSAIQPDGSGQINVAIALRADFYPQCAVYPPLRTALSEQQEFIGPMDTEGLRRAIERPALQGGWEFQPGLVDLIIREVGGEPGALPLLSHALLECWQRRSGRMMTLKGYAQAGGVRSAIARTAERAYQGLQPEEQAIARRIFLRLTNVGEAGSETRRRAALSELVSGSEESGSVGRVLEKLTAKRLITLGRDWVEVAHEALLREWPTLQGWLEGGREALRIHRHLTQASQEWEARGGDEADLFRGGRLVRAQEWATEHPEEMNQLERSFLAASAELTERRQTEREAQRQRELEVARRLAESEKARAEQEVRTSGRLRRYAIALAGLLALALAAAGFALQQRNLATAEAHMAKAREFTAASGNNLGVDPELSILLALEALEESAAAGQPAPRQVEEALHQAVLASRTEAVLIGHTDRILDAAFSPDGSLVATASADGTVRIWDSSSGEARFSLENGARRPIKAVAFHPDGRYLASGGNDRVVRIWDLVSGELIREMEGHSHWVQDVAFSPDGNLLASAGKGGIVQIWDWRSGELHSTLSHLGPSVASVSFEPDSAHVVGADLVGQILIWEIDQSSPQSVITIEDIPPEMLGSPGTIGASALSPDGRWIAATNPGGTAHIWSVETGERLLSIEGGTGGASDLAFSPDGEWLASGGFDRQAHIWDAASGGLVLDLIGHQDRIYSVAFSPDGRRLVTAGEDQTARIWNISLPVEIASVPTGSRVTSLAFGAQGQTLFAELQGQVAPLVWSVKGDQPPSPSSPQERGSWLPSLAISPDGETAAIAGIDQVVRLWDLSIGEALPDLPPHDARVDAVAFSPDGRLLAAGSADALVKIWDVSTRKMVGNPFVAGDSVTSLAFDPSGSQLGAGNLRGDIIVWDLEDGEALYLTAHAGRMNRVVFHPNGSLLASAGEDGTARIWDLEEPDRSIDLIGHDAAVKDIAFNRDGSQVATVGGDGSLRLWDSASGEELLSLSPSGWESPSQVVFSPEDETLAISDSRGIYLLASDIDDLAELGRRRASRGFSADECRVFLAGRDCAPSEVADAVDYLPPAEEHRICEITETAGVYDGGYGQETYEGILLVSNELGWDRFVYESEFLDDPPRAMQRVLRSNCDLIVSPGALFTGLTRNAAQAHPERAFQLIDVAVENPAPNIWSQLYAPDQPAFLAGYLAASVSRTGIVATYGGVNFAPVRHFMIGFEAGVRSYNTFHRADVALIGWDTESGTGQFVGDFCCPPEGMEFTLHFIEQGADVIMPVGGPYITNGSVIEASKHEGIYIIGVDVDQALATPEFAGVVLTSVEKRARVSILRAARAVQAGTFEGGTYTGTLETGEVGLSPFHELDDLVSDQLKAELQRLREDIIAGRISTRP